MTPVYATKADADWAVSGELVDLPDPPGDDTDDDEDVATPDYVKSVLGFDPDNEEWDEPTDNVFCPTGQGGGVDPSCSPSGSKGADNPSAKWTTVYHGTTKHMAINGILTGGLRLGEKWQDRAPSVYFTPSEERALHYAVMRGGRELSAVVEFELPESYKEKVIKDTVDGNQAYRIEESLGSRFIKAVHTYDSDGKRISTKTNPKFDPTEVPVDNARTKTYYSPVVLSVKTENVFCPTGPGGGIDPTCSPSGSTYGKGGESLNQELRRRSEIALKDADDVVNKAIEEGREVEFGATSWDDLDDDVKSQAEQSWLEDHLSEYEEEPYQEWSDEVMQEVTDDVNEDTGFGQELWDEFAEEHGLKDEWRDAYQDLADGEMQIEYVDDEMRRYFEEPRDDPNQRTFGFSEEKVDTVPLKEKLEHFVRGRVEEEIQDRFEKETSDGPPDHVYESANQAASEAFSNLDDDEKLSLAGRDGSVSGTLELPKTFKVTENGKDYDRSRQIALTIQHDLTLKRAEELGFSGDDVDAKGISHDVWKEWKGSSTSDVGLLLQYATAQEFGSLSQKFDDSQMQRVNKAAVKMAEKYYNSTDSSASEDELIDVGVNLVRAHAYGTWASTQYVMEKAGVDSLPLYRAVMIAGDKLESAKVEEVPVKSPYSYEITRRRLPDLSLLKNGAASTAAGDVGMRVANRWNGVGQRPQNAKRVVLRFDAPRTTYLSIPVFGQNVHNEHEVVTIGTSHKWDAWLHHAPSLEEVPIAD